MDDRESGPAAAGQGSAKKGVRRAHMVSRGYLKAWADSRGVIEVIDKQKGERYPSSIKNATIVSYVYDSSVLTQDLEAEFAAVEDAGIPAIDKLRRGETDLSADDMHALIAFLDMHLHRGRYADRAGVRVPAQVLRTDGTIEAAELALGDLLTLARGLDDIVQLRDLGLEHWYWQILLQERPLATGDGAVMLWSPAEGSPVSTVTFPLSPTQLLVVGEALREHLPISAAIAKNSKRWLVGLRGTLNLARHQPSS
ncbi:hypothetical protein CBF90_02090 [Microbacterium sp. AISO3]|uniref:DUF4238 domain-containing protein n=1 Tax=Microbacterium sp. AISO3 TaxID=2002831 RepID=UPI000B68CEAB|nr:DUF4238 domain-containing protein [Microbacterium sp. AISO3]OWP20308.1 hypothetical protein CBF90_17155 [Microbacterium sp. AISO3]OWP23539.1 hypothetical protein CBF90_02090 [Microbacterium sp. AISO3]